MSPKPTYIDINCDVGEGIGNEKDLMPLISSCNIACGGHAGDMESMRTAALLAYQYEVRVGAHPSYPDKENFGRVSMDIPSDELIGSIQEQLETFTSILKKENIPLHHIKPHGALYNDIAKDDALAKTFLTSIEKYKDWVFIYVPYGSAIEKESINQGFKIKYEAFGDRNYNSDLSLVSRNVANALLEDPKMVLQHILHIAKKNQVRTVKDELVKIKADTYCIHGDTPSALQILMYLSKELSKYNLQIKK